MLYKITERVEAEYGPDDHDKLVNNLEPLGIVSCISIVFMILYAAIFG